MKSFLFSEKRSERRAIGARGGHFRAFTPGSWAFSSSHIHNDAVAAGVGDVGSSAAANRNFSISALNASVENKEPEKSEGS